MCKLETDPADPKRTVELLQDLNQFEYSVVTLIKFKCRRINKYCYSVLLIYY